jgi:hypothetical protein
MVPRLKKALRVPTPADRGPGRPWRPGTPPPAPIEVKAHAPHRRVIFTVSEMKRLGRDAAELTALADHLTAHGVEQIQPDLIIPTGKRKGQNPSVASIYRALAEHAKREAYPEAVE